MSGNGIGVGRGHQTFGMEGFQLNFEGHCSICLQLQLGELPGVFKSIPRQLNNFQPIIHYLTGTDPSHANSHEEYEELGIPVMESSPPMCPSCYEILAELYRLHQELMRIQVSIQKQTELAREVIIKANQPSIPSDRHSSSPRKQFYFRILSSGKPAAEIAAVKKFLDNLHDKASVEGKRPVRFPICVLENFHPSASSATNSRSALPLPNAEYVSAEEDILPPGNEDNVEIKIETEEESMNADFDNLQNEIDDLFSPPSEVSRESDNTLAPADPISKSSSLPSSFKRKEILPRRSRPGPACSKISKTGVKTNGKLTGDYIRGNRALPSATVTSRKRKVDQVTTADISIHSNRKLVAMKPSVLELEMPESMLQVKYENEYEDTDEECDVYSPRGSEIEERDKDDFIPYSCDQSSSSSWSPSSPRPSSSKKISTKKQLGTAKAISSPGEPHSTSKRKRANLQSKVTSGGSKKADSTPAKIPNTKIRTDKPSTVAYSESSRPPTVRPLVFTGMTTSQYCDICGELCPSSEITNHLKTQHHVQDYIKPCPNPSCPGVFSCRGKMEMHLAQYKAKPNIRPSEVNKCRQIAKLKPPRYQTKKCEVCNFQTKSDMEFTTHLGSHETATQEKNVRCPIPQCGLQFGCRQSVEEHLLSHTNQGQHHRSGYRPVSRGSAKHICDICGENFPTKGMVHHLEVDHNLKEYVTKCPNSRCLWAFPCRGKMERHLSSSGRTCQKITGYPISADTRKCETCNIQVNKKSFIKHLQRHENRIMDKIIPCPIQPCPDRYALKQTMEEHLMTHDRRLTDVFKKQDCPLCQKSSQIEDVAEHLKDVHGVENIIKCRRCPYVFHDWGFLLDHLEKHRYNRVSGLGLDGGGFFCDICNDACGTKFSRYESLRRHFFNVHKIGSKFTCETCDLDCYSQTALSSHQEKNHNTVANDELPPTKTIKPAKTLQCDQCPNPETTRFPTKLSLGTHKIREHGAPPALCKFCGEAFRSLVSLGHHERSHMGIAVTYKCRAENCGKVFKNKHIWKDHEEAVHNNPDLKLYVCDTCGKGYASKYSLYYHKQIHKKKDRIKAVVPVTKSICEVCGQSFSTAQSLKRHNLVHTGDRT